jgi:hypothetical protein
MTEAVVAVRLVGPSPEAIELASTTLAEGVAGLGQPVELRLHPPRLGRDRKRWLVYGRLHIAPPADLERQEER